MPQLSSRFTTLPSLDADGAASRAAGPDMAATAAPTLRSGTLARMPRMLLVGLAVATSLALSTAAIAIIEQIGHASYAAPVYLLAVLAVGTMFGTLPAVGTSVAAFLLYDFLFVQPLYTFTIASPDEWLNLVLLLIVSVVVGRLVALLARRAEEAAEQAREARTLFRISGALATAPTVAEVGEVVLGRLAEATAMDRAWLALGTGANERVIADTAADQPLPVPARQVVLFRAPGGEASRWVRTHVPSTSGPRRPGQHATVHRVKVEVPGQVLGSIWALRGRGERDPDRVETLILAAAADQLAQAVIRDRLVREGMDAEIARQSEALKTALLDSVSHDLRTPLATIRAAAGSLLDASVHWSPEEQRATLQTIDAQADRMNRLVRNLLDLSRIEAGALKPELQAEDVDEAVEPAIRLARASTAKSIELHLADELPAVLIDEVYFAQIILNLLENAIRYGGNCIRVAAHSGQDGSVAISVEDDGEGVPSSSLGHLFEKFYRVPGSTSRAGMGIGLTVVKGLATAMGGTVAARPSELGGLAVVVNVRAALSASMIPNGASS